jgi:ABC-type oligopeptide transport system substrate-binding subunit/ABC-type branched-subunit amino acid transport system substrate-binding protein
MPQTCISKYIVIIAVLICYACSNDSITSEERAKIAAKSNDDIYIGLIDSSSDPSMFSEGVHLAIEEINKQGEFSGKQIKPIYYNVRKYQKMGQGVDRKLAANPKVVAVIDHRHSGAAIPASIVYENYGILYIATAASDPNFTRYGGKLTFRNTISDSDTGKEIAKFANQQGYKKIAVIYERETIGQRLADIIGEEVDTFKIQIVAVRSYFSGQEDFRYIASELAMNYQFDAIFLGGLLPFAGEIIKQIRSMGIKVPIIGSPNLDSLELFPVAGRSAEHVFVPTIFNPDMSEKETKGFVKKFQKKYGLLPDTLAALGYDAIQLFAYAIENSGSTVPIVMASTLRFLKNWKGVTGSYSFTQYGDIASKKIFFKEFIDGKFKLLDYGITKSISPFLIDEQNTLRLAFEGAINTVDPAYANEIYTIEIVEQLFLGLTDFDPKTYKVVPELAESWTVSDNKIKYTFKLRKDVQWTNGKPVTAGDIVWAIQRNISLETNCPTVFMLYVLKNAHEIYSGIIKDVTQIGVHALDDYTVVFDLAHPSVYFPSMSGLPVFRPLPREAIEKYNKKWIEPENIQTNGSYKLAYWDKSLVMVLQKNPDYFDARHVEISEVRYNIIPNNTIGMVMYENNELDIIGGNYLKIPFSKLNNIQNNPNLNDEYIVKPMLSTYAYGFDLKNPPMNNLLVRKAICAAVDRESLIDLITKGNETPATTYTPPPILGPFNEKENIGIHFSPLQAKKWLAEAGYPDGKNFPTIALLFNESKNHFEIARAVQASLKHYLNIKLKLLAVNWNNYVNNISEASLNNYHMYRFGWSIDYPDPNNVLNELFNPNSPFKFFSWENEEYVDLMKKTIVISDINERKRLYKRAEKIVCGEQAIVFPLFFESAHYLVKQRVKNWTHMTFGGQHIRNWSLVNKN